MEAVECSLAALAEMNRLRAKLPFEGRQRRPIVRQVSTLPLLIEDEIMRDQIAHAQRQRAGVAVDGPCTDAVGASALATEEDDSPAGESAWPPPEVFALAYEMSLDEALEYEMTLED